MLPGVTTPDTSCADKPRPLPLATSGTYKEPVLMTSNEFTHPQQRTLLFSSTRQRVTHNAKQNNNREDPTYITHCDQQRCNFIKRTLKGKILPYKL